MMTAIQDKRATFTNGSLIYLKRDFPNLLRHRVNEIGVEEIKAAEIRDSVLGVHLDIEKTTGEKISVSGLDRGEAIRLVELVSNSKDDSIEDGADPGNVQGLLPDFGLRIEEIFRDKENCISRLVDMIIEKAIELEASDIHIEPLENIKIRYRVDGVLLDAAEISIDYHARVASRVKVLAKLPTYEKDVPLDGRIEADLGPGLDLRVSTFPTVRGDKVVIRIFDSGRNLYRLDELGFSSPIHKRFESLALRPEGAIILTGPANSGKTTTIYSALERIYEVKKNTVNIVTIEDPVERDLKKFSQTQIALTRGLTFVSALRSLLRQDPNVIVVGEIRDLETANTAIRAGMTGHLVITTIHSGTAAGALARLIEMGLEPFIAASSVTGIMAQRLVRRVCPSCSVKVAPSEELRHRFGIDDDSFEQMIGGGCAECAGSGYRGRTAIAELLIVDDAIREATLARSSVNELRKVAKSGGMSELPEDGLAKVREGVTNLEELARVLVPDEV